MNRIVWKESNTWAFDECIVSWNGLRPLVGRWVFWVSLQQAGNWSSWLKYAEWGVDHQRTFRNESKTVHSYQDAVHPKEGLCDGFRVRVETEGGADLSGLVSLSASLSQISKWKEGTAKPASPIPSDPLSAVLLTSKHGQSQIALAHPISKRICSPTSVANAIDVLMQKKVDPLVFASQVYDSGFDIYGNWILNVAAAYSEMGGAYSCHVERLPSFEALHRELRKGFPVIISVRGPLEGAPQPYSKGHLLCVVGYRDNQVICIDPGHPQDLATFCHYPLASLIEAWGRRGNIAYIFGRSVEEKLAGIAPPL